MKKLLLALALTSFLTVNAQPVQACSCVMPGSPAEEMERSDAVFSGAVKKIESVSEMPGFSPLGYTVTFQVLEVWKGVQEPTLSVYTASDSAACGYPFEEGRKYMVYATEFEGELQVYSCGITSLLADADTNALGEGTAISESTSFVDNDLTQLVFLLGLISTIILVMGSAWPDRSKQKDWIFLAGNFGMFAYSIVAYFNGNPVFYILLEVLCVLASIFAVAHTKEKYSKPIILALGAVLLLTSFYLLENLNTVWFILGLTLLALAFVTKNFRTRNLLFIAGCILLSLFSYLESSWIYFWLNIIFGLFSIRNFFKKS